MYKSINKDTTQKEALLCVKLHHTRARQQWKSRGGLISSYMGNSPGESPPGHVTGLWALAMAMESGSLLSWFSPAGGSGDCAGGSGDCSSDESDYEVCSESEVADPPILDSSGHDSPEIPEKAHQPFLSSFPK